MAIDTFHIAVMVALHVTEKDGQTTIKPVSATFTRDEIRELAQGGSLPAERLRDVLADVV